MKQVSVLRGPGGFGCNNSFNGKPKATCTAGAYGWVLNETDEINHAVQLQAVVDCGMPTPRLAVKQKLIHGSGIDADTD